MYKNLVIGAVIPACNEEDNIGPVVSGLLALRADSGDAVFDEVVVCDNASTDGTAARAADAGARVVFEASRGYGSACLSAIAALRPVDVVLFIDGDQAFDVQSVAGLASCDRPRARTLLSGREHWVELSTGRSHCHNESATELRPGSSGLSGGTASRIWAPSGLYAPRR